ncbi:Hypothetical protein ORPV_181 [Orpheovirus IHUMI-LCC2]|uniref:Uncharacterized protein n=1 Tax=Orpheovirus IHUMI-LCC2 TaxID=2023057 RepID=A0A2I2L3G4_9VIRU|nr:Hypothetical protein ORPV_181 [Orpheovirus IHUMI-LCC2]SNW62085.1 Hypothetical protein ORPV_181 [Orpheovirus IHUMI-LCC2]
MYHNNNNNNNNNNNEDLEMNERQLKRKLTTNKSFLSSLLSLLDRQKNRKGGSLLHLLSLVLDLAIPFGIELAKQETRDLENEVYALPEEKREQLLNDISVICDKYDMCRDGLLELKDKSFSHVDDIVDVIDKKLDEIMLHPNSSVVSKISERYEENSKEYHG